jgi:hypothetical protein
MVLEQLLLVVIWKYALILILLQQGLNQKMPIVLRTVTGPPELQKHFVHSSSVKNIFKEKESIDMSKGIAIQTILYLLIGVLVVGVVVYLVYTYVMNPVLPETQCRAIATSWCTSCKTSGWTGGPATSDDLEACGGRYWPPLPANCAAADTFCSQCCAIT